MPRKISVCIAVKTSCHLDGFIHRSEFSLKAVETVNTMTLCQEIFLLVSHCNYPSVTQLPLVSTWVLWPNSISFSYGI